MESYIQTAEQIKEDILAEYVKTYPGSSIDDVYGNPDGLRVLDNIEIVLRNSAKQKIFSERVRGLKKSKLDGDEILTAYLTTEDNESYTDSLDSISCSKKICYFLFTMRYNNFGLKERSKYADILRKQENLCPAKNIEIYNIKKSLINCMHEGNPVYSKIQPLIAQYLQALRTLLDGQKKIYQCETDLIDRFNIFLKELIVSDISESRFKNDKSSLKILMQVILALEKRGLETPKIEKTLKNQSIESITIELDEHLQNLKDECDILSEVTSFLEDVILYIELSRKKEENEAKKEAMEEKESGTNLMSYVKESFSSTFADWLNK